MLRIYLFILRARLLLAVWVTGFAFLAGGVVQLGDGGKAADSVLAFTLAALLLAAAIVMTRRRLDRLHVDNLMQASRDRKRREAEGGDARTLRPSCAECASPNDEDAAFCTKCGSALAQGESRATA